LRAPSQETSLITVYPLILKTARTYPSFVYASTAQLIMDERNNICCPVNPLYN
jgi:hypothetical protein